MNIKIAKQKIVVIIQKIKKIKPTPHHYRNIIILLI